jgi:hypothetical protein
MAVALTMVVAILAWLNTQKSHTLSISSANNNMAIQQKETMVSAKPDVKSRTPTTVKPEIQRRVTKAPEFAKEPRLNQFPSPAPLNEQEELLARYVQSRHPEAVMVARVRAEIERQNLERMEQTDSE